MYLVLEDAVKKSLEEKTKFKESFNTSLLEMKKKRKIIIFMIFIILLKM